MRSTGMLTVSEAAQLLGYSDCTVWRHINRGLIKKVQVDKWCRVFIPHEEIIRIKTGIVISSKGKSNGK